MRLTLTHMLSFEANASPFSGLALDRLSVRLGRMRPTPDQIAEAQRMAREWKPKRGCNPGC